MKETLKKYDEVFRKYQNGLIDSIDFAIAARYLFQDFIHHEAVKAEETINRIQEKDIKKEG